MVPGRGAGVWGEEDEGLRREFWGKRRGRGREGSVGEERIAGGVLGRVFIVCFVIFILLITFRYLILTVFVYFCIFI